MFWLGLLLLLAAPATALHRLAGTGDHAPLFAALAALNGLTFVFYWFDKRRAQAGGGRVPEIWLHALEFAGGWPAAFTAQQILRHKNAKTGYQIVFWSIVVLYEAVSIDAALGWSLGRDLAGLLH